MRIPRVARPHAGVLRQFGLPLRPFVMGNPKGLVYVGGERMTAERGGRASPIALPLRAGGPRARPARPTLWECGDQRPPRAGANERPGRVGVHLSASTTSTRSTSSCVMKGFCEGAIEDYGVMNFVEADMNNAVVEVLREDLGKAYVDMQEIAGGMDRLPQRLLRASCRTEVRFGAEVLAIDQDPTSVTVHYKTEAGRFCGHGRLRDVHAPVLGAADVEVADAVLAREAARDPPAQLPRLDQDPVPGPRARSGRTRTASSAAPPSRTCRSGA